MTEEKYQKLRLKIKDKHTPLEEIPALKELSMECRRIKASVIYWKTKIQSLTRKIEIYKEKLYSTKKMETYLEIAIKNHNNAKLKFAEL